VVGQKAGDKGCRHDGQDHEVRGRSDEPDFRLGESSNQKVDRTQDDDDGHDIGHRRRAVSTS
jgi:hypothetical protein